MYKRENLHCARICTSAFIEEGKRAFNGKQLDAMTKGCFLPFPIFD